MKLRKHKFQGPLIPEWPQKLFYSILLKKLGLLYEKASLKNNISDIV